MSKLNFVIAVLALVLATFALFKQSAGPNSHVETSINTAAGELEPIELIAETTQDLDVEQLQQVINQLNKRLHQLESKVDVSAPLEQHIEELVQDYVAKASTNGEQSLSGGGVFQRIYENLPDDYEERLKTDPQYAVQMQAELEQKILDTSLSELERLQAMAQLQMTKGILGEYEDLDNNYELSNAIIDIAENTSDPATRIRALEVVTSTVDINPKLESTFMNLVVNDDNNYVRNIAAHGLGMMMYNPDLSEQKRQQLANDIISLMSETSDPKLRKTLEQTFGNEEEIRQSLEHMAEGQ